MKIARINSCINRLLIIIQNALGVQVPSSYLNSGQREAYDSYNDTRARYNVKRKEKLDSTSPTSN